MAARNHFSPATSLARTAASTSLAALLAGCMLAGGAMTAASAQTTHRTAPAATTAAAASAPVPDSGAQRAAIPADEMGALPDPSTLAPASATQRESAMDVVLAQLDAFRAGDFDRADALQSISLRASFDSPQQFRSLMSQVYPEFIAYQAATFGDARASRDGRYVLLPIAVTGQDGVTVQALYLMVQESGRYRVLTVLGGMNPHVTPADSAEAARFA